MKKLEIKLRHFEELETIMDREKEAVSIYTHTHTHINGSYLFYSHEVQYLKHYHSPRPLASMATQYFM